MIADCNGTDIQPPPTVFPGNCFLPPIIWDPPFPGGGGGPIICFNEGGIATLCPSPILIDTNGNGFDLTDTNNGVNFDLKPDGVAERISWTAARSDDSFLVLDRNSNGTIDNGGELFGNYTPQPSSDDPNGFLALAEFDQAQKGGNGDGVIDRRDGIFPILRLWRDQNHNGVSEITELSTLSSSEIVKLDLDYRPSNRRDQYGNRFRFRARIYDSREAQIGRWAWDVFFIQQ